MPQSFARLSVHLIFSTKHREPILCDMIRGELHAYMSKVLKNVGCLPIIINSVEDHTHHLFDLGRTLSVSQVVEELKKSSSKWIKTKGPEFKNFAWQSGYGAFAVSESNMEIVREYIAKQKEHHRQKSFQDEYRQFLERHHIRSDERYMWD